MNTYRIWYVKGQRGPTFIQADAINGFGPDSDTGVFKIGDEVTAAIPKARVTSVQWVKSTTDEPE